MKALQVRAYRLEDGKTMTLPDVLEAELAAGLDTPVQSFSGIFACRERPGTLGDLEVRHDGQLLFRGRVDEQKLEIAKGTTLQLRARSFTSVLLDNEAQPRTLVNPNLYVAYHYLVKPYRFECYGIKQSVRLPTYTVHKGMSEWDAFCGFTRRAQGVTPYVYENSVIVDRPRYQGVLTISNSGAGVPYSLLEEHIVPYNIITRVMVRDGQGEYSVGVDNPEAAWWYLYRKRYSIPDSEFADSGRPDAARRIRESMLSAREINVVLPGLIKIGVGYPVNISDERFTRSGLLARTVRQQISAAGGAVTRLTLVDGRYY